MPWARMIRARGIQSVSSPSIKWPMLSKGLKVSGPSVPRAHSGPTFCSSVRSAPGVRPRPAIAFRRSKAISRNLSLPVYAVHETMDHRGQEQRRHNQEDAARVEGKDAGEHLATICVRRVHRTHPAQQHGGVEKRITPRPAALKAVAFEVCRQAPADRSGHRVQTAMVLECGVPDERPPVQSERGNPVTECFFDAWSRGANSDAYPPQCRPRLRRYRREVGPNL